MLNGATTPKNHRATASNEAVGRALAAKSATNPATAAVGQAWGELPGYNLNTPLLHDSVTTLGIAPGKFCSFLCFFFL